VPTEVNIGVMVLMAFIALLGGASATAAINQFARRRVTRAESDSLTVESALKLIAVQQSRIDQGEEERAKLEVKVDAMHGEINQLRNELAQERIRCDHELSEVRLELLAALDVLRRHGIGE